MSTSTISDPQPVGQADATIAAHPERAALLAAGARLGYPRLPLAYSRDAGGHRVPFLWLAAGESAWRQHAWTGTGEDLVRALAAVKRQEAF